jgi:ABC-type multidrug transport system fused ATPase/permease subunit
MGPVGSGRPPTTVTTPLSNASAAAIPAAGAGRASEIVFDAVTKRYPRRAEPAVSSLSLTVPAGEICVLVGPSGPARPPPCGWSTG